MNFTLDNLWGTLKGLIDLCMGLPEGEFVLMRDGSKSVIRIYSKNEEEAVQENTAQSEVDADKENDE
jgi:translation initiation factor 3 subunit D